jgi:hypothetical protein
MAKSQTQICIDRGPSPDCWGMTPEGLRICLRCTDAAFKGPRARISPYERPPGAPVQRYAGRRVVRFDAASAGAQGCPVRSSM